MDRRTVPRDHRLSPDPEEGIDTASKYAKFGALTTKVRFLYGRRLRGEDYARMVSMHTVGEVVSYLKRQTAWGKWLPGLDETNARRSLIEDSLQYGIINEYLKLLRFVPGCEQGFVDFYVYLAETRAILKYLTHLNMESLEEFNPAFPDLFRRKSRIDFQKLSLGKTYEDLVRAVEGTAYHTILVNFTPKAGEELDYVMLDTLLRTNYYRHLYESIARSTDPVAKKLMQQHTGEVIDLANVTRVIRFRTMGFHESIDVFKYLLPFEHQLSKKFYKKLFEAPTEQANLELLRASPYKKAFEGASMRYVEENCQRYLFESDKRMFSSCGPSVYAAVSYLNLKEIEVSNLVHIVECVRYGMAPQEIRSFLIGAGA